jgi:hypothetical protein
MNLPLTSPTVSETETAFEIDKPKGLLAKLRLKKGEKIPDGGKLFRRRGNTDTPSTPAESLTKKLLGSGDGSVNTPSRARGIFGIKGRGVVLENMGTGNAVDAATMVTNNTPNNLSEL